MPPSKLRHADYALIPVIRVEAAPRNQWRQVLEITDVGDWTTLCLSGNVIPTDAGGLNAGAVCVQVLFYQLSGTSTIPSYDNTVIVGGRSLCVGLSNQRTFYQPSSLDVRLPIIAPFVEVLVYFPTNQVDQRGLDIGAWVTNDPSYQYVNPFPVGYLTSAISAGDSILGANNAGFLGDLAQGILVPAGMTVSNELASQTIGKGYFAYTAETVSGAPLVPSDVNSFVINKSPTDTTGTDIDQVIFEFGNAVRSAQGGIPLTGFRQAVIMLNATAPARDVVFHWTAWPEFD